MNVVQKRPRICANELSDVVLRCKESSAVGAVKNHFNCSRGFVRVMRHAEESTYNKNIRLWSAKDTLPDAPFGVGLYYAKSSRVVPLFIVQQLPQIQKRTAIKDIEGNDTEKMVSLAEIVTWAIAYIASFDCSETNLSSEKIATARAFMWRMCDANARPLFLKLEDAREVQFPRGLKPLNCVDDSVNIGDSDMLEKKNWAWITDWVRERAKVLRLDV